MARRKLDVSFGVKRVKPEDTLESGLPPEMRRRPKGERDLSVFRNKPRTAVEAQLEQRYGLEPGIQRPGLVPLSRNPRTGNIELTMPQAGYDLLRAFEAPGVVLAGNPVDLQDEASNFALNVSGLGGGANFAVRPAKGVVLGMSGARRRAAEEGVDLGVKRAVENAPKLRIKPSPDDVNEVMQANTTAGRVVGNRTRNIDELTGGVSQAVDDQRRVDALVKEMSSPNGYISRLIVDDAGNVIEGQHRLEALRRLGVTDVPVTEYKDFERDIDFPALKEAIRSAQPMHSDNVNQLAASIAETYADEGGNLSEIAQYEPPKGFEQGWQAGIDALSFKPTESSLSVGKVPATATPAEEGVDLAAREVVRPQGIIAYHGSPHSFERFDISKIGTGEGSQAYGHGLYFAEAEPVAAEYRQRLANVTAAPFDVIGIPPKEWNAALMFARQMDPTQPDVAARDFAQWVGRDVTPELVDAFRVAREPGNMYQVKLNVRPEDLLDWDRPISTQSDIVQRAAREADIGHLKPGSKSRVMMDWFREGNEQPHNLAKGRDLMMALDQSLGNNFTPEVSSQLSQFGIPGIQYLDEKSRPLGEGTRNYVMFDDALIDLLRKYAEGGFVTPLSVR